MKFDLRKLNRKLQIF